MTDDKALVILSGGQDSTTCLYWALRGGYEVATVTFDYNQRHRRELDAVKKILELSGVKGAETIKLDGILKGASPLIDGSEIKEYRSSDDIPDGIENTFVPMRNQLFLTVAANRAYVLGIRNLIIGVSAVDYGGYPDCRKDFITAMKNACNLGTFTGEPGTVGPLNILTPLMELDKRQTVELAVRLPGCYRALAYSHTNYDGEYPPTSKDHASLLRAKGFYEADVPDPLVWRAVDEGLMPIPQTSNYSEEKLAKYAPLYKGETKCLTP